MCGGVGGGEAEAECNGFNGLGMRGLYARSGLPLSTLSGEREGENVIGIGCA